MKKRNLLTLSFSICLILVLATVSLLTACAKPAPAEPAPAEPVPAEPVLAPTGPIEWDEAADYIGATATVCGPVISLDILTKGGGNKHILNLGLAEDGFKVAVQPYYVKTQFPSGSLEDYVGKTVCASGEIGTSPLGGPEMTINYPSQIEVQE